MSDPNAWSTPGGDTSPPRWGERVDPTSPGPVPAGPVPGAAPGGSTPPAPGWAPPPKPGLVPLRPLTFGEILGASFQVFRRNPRTTFGTALLSQVVLLVVTVVITGGSAFLAFGRVEQALPRDRDAVLAGAVAVVAASALVPIALQVIVTALLQGLFVLETSRQTLGEKLRLGGLWAMAKGRVGTLVGWSALLTVAYVVALALVAGVVVVGVAVGSGPSIAVGVVLAVLLGLGLLVLGVWLTVKTALVPSAIMLERLTLGAAVRRSWSLTRASFWRTFGVIALVFLMVQVASQVVATPFSVLFSVLTGTLAPTGDVTDPTFLALTAGTYAVTLGITAVIGAIGSVLQAASAGLVYVDRRIRTEGLDLELVRYVERGGRAVGGQPDPYRTPEAPVPPTTHPGAPRW
ncbi:hypothetical protein IFT79_05635 [Frigoribacterium sp. CFBP 8759]|jgi:MFS family permease|uniref:hypothetical protein n=1 Tax=Frigoribacterium sp. CFBP 8759 TaxID=2775283 RepID=UPI00177FC6C7|nr:hypothetical protein [Frigoribacterium sp. CFBP 8759]MBD8485093.1 hypothetical protein [Frigoribacterium sp. CFBP 8759]